jgi:2-dehydropantoate 2-reductase
VEVCARSEEAARRVAAEGILVEEPETAVRWSARVAARAGAPEAGRGPVFLCVRGPDTREASRALAAGTQVVNVQNGVDGDGVLAERLEHVIGAVIRHNCTRVEANRVRTRSAARIALGRHPAGLAPEVERIAALLRGAGYDVGVSSRIGEDRWLKLCINLMSTPNALVRPAEHATHAFVEGKVRLLEEARDVLAAAGIAARSCDGRDRGLDEEIAFQRAAGARGGEARRLPLYNSLWQGLRRNASLEVDAYHLSIIGLGRRHGVPTPMNERALEGVLRAAREGLGPECYGAEELLGPV